MQMDDLARAYASKTDEELLFLAHDLDGLRPEARLALQSEFARRGLKTPEHDAGSKSGEANSAPVNGQQRLFFQDLYTVGNLVETVTRVYYGHFWLFIKLISPAVILGYLAIATGRNEGREIARHLPPGLELFRHKTE